ncbi:hypothetical protein B4U84_18735 [Westiellopsis prolifica IICB1]|nr:hypothetical protein B4U84_18735 [Westiellopsis prolifica IICB1]
MERKNYQNAQEGVKKEISKHKVAGRPIFYSRASVAIMELSDGRCFEYNRTYAHSTNPWRSTLR